MSSTRDAMTLFYEVRDQAIRARIDETSIGDANIVYACLHSLLMRAKLDASYVPILKREIRELPYALIIALGVETGFDAVREAALKMRIPLMRTLRPITKYNWR